jgi:hypothetical protein
MLAEIRRVEHPDDWKRHQSNETLLLRSRDAAKRQSPQPRLANCND